MWTIVTLDPLKDLVQTVEELRDSGTLEAEQANGLLQKVSQAQAKLDDSSNPDQADRACYQLTAFVDQVQGLEIGGVLTEAQAYDLTCQISDSSIGPLHGLAQQVARQRLRASDDRSISAEHFDVKLTAARIDVDQQLAAGQLERLG